MARPKHSILVGASKGIGRVLARSFLAADHEVTVVSRSAPAELSEARHLHVDLRDSESVNRVVQALREDHSPFRNLVFLQRLREDADGDRWHDEIAISVNATRMIVEGLVADRSEAEPGSIVMVSSLASDLVVLDQPLAYHVAKAALNTMARYYAVQLASCGIRVNAVSPGLVLKEEAEDYFKENPAVYEGRVRRTPLRRMATAREVADIIGYVCSDQAAFITGQVIVADGGMTLVFQGSLT